MDEIAWLADRFWPTRWHLRVERLPGGRDVWRSRLQLRRGAVILESTESTAEASLLGIAASLRRMDAGRPVLSGLSAAPAALEVAAA